MCFKKWILVLFGIGFILTANITTSSVVNSSTRINEIMFYGAPASWGGLGHDIDGDPIMSPTESAQVFYYWGDYVESLLGYDTVLHADLIYISPISAEDKTYGYNTRVQETMDTIFLLATLKGKSKDVVVSIDVAVPGWWEAEDIQRCIIDIFSNQTNYLNLNSWQSARYRSRIFLSLDLEVPVFYNNLILSAGDMNALYDTYASLHVIDSPPLYVYDVSNMFPSTEPPQFNKNIIPIYNGSSRPDVIVTGYNNVRNIYGRSPGLMLFVLPHLSASQRRWSFDRGDVAGAVDWLQDQPIYPPVLAFQ